MMFEMSYFNAPIAPVRDGDGRVIRMATVMPQMTVTLSRVYNIITADESLRRVTELVRSAADFRAAKAMMLPYVTPCGVFSYRKASAMVRLSGLLPLDIDHLDSREEAERLRDRLFADEYLRPVLCFVSPSGRGVKAFVRVMESVSDSSREAVSGVDDKTVLLDVSREYAMEYVRSVYGDCDPSGKDAARACFLCHDGGGRIRY